MLCSFMTDKAKKNVISNYLQTILDFPSNLVVAVYLFHLKSQNNQFVFKETKKITKMCSYLTKPFCFQGHLGDNKKLFGIHA